MTKLKLSQKLVLIGMIIVGVAFSCQKKENPNQPLQSLDQSEITVDYSKAILQAGLVDSQKVDYDTPPMPVGGFEALGKDLIFPEFAKKASSTFNVKVNENGEISAVQMIGSPHGLKGLTGEQIRAVAYCEGRLSAVISFSKWSPATKKGRPIAAWVTLPIQYKDVAQEIVLSSEVPRPPPSPSDEGSSSFVAYDEPPEPIGGFAAIQKNLIYPELARRAGIEGTVTVQAKIDENGDVLDPKILVPLGESGCNEAAVSAIKSVKWRPAQANGKPVAVWVSVPVRFRLK